MFEMVSITSMTRHVGTTTVSEDGYGYRRVEDTTGVYLASR